MKISFFHSDKLERPMRLSVHKSGKLGFTNDAAGKLALNTSKSVSIGFNAEDQEDKSLYMVINDSVVDGSFKISKAGDYFYANIRYLLDSLKVDYRSEAVAYKVERVEIDGQAYFRMTRIVKQGKELDDDDEDEEV